MSLGKSSKTSITNDTRNLYRGRFIKEVELPDMDPKDVNYSIRVESKMNSQKEQPELPKVKRGLMAEGGGGRPRPAVINANCVGKPERRTNKGKKLIHDNPLIRLPEKEPVRFERVKGIYSNVKNYDNL